ncbi:hypothetical protein PENSPDRAFT_362117 [Peniophora sp. CONT]|nr:hypothetical protein PENSPDRAFT_362117 [Peniophora sp. CONT]
MVNWHDPTNVAIQIAALEKTYLILCGIYLYDFLCSLPFDLSLLVGKDGLRRCSLSAKSVKAVYLSCRYLVLASCIVHTYTNFRSAREPIPCWTLLKLSTGTGFLGATCSSALIAIRVAVVWTWNTKVTALIALLLLAVLGTGIRIAASISSSYDPVLRICSLENERSNLANVIALIVCDSVLLVFLLVGLYRWHQPKSGIRAFRLWSILWGQGVLYLALASATEVPALVFLLLNLNPVMNTIFLGPEVVILALAATRFYRSLTTFTSNRSYHNFTETICFATIDIGPPKAEYELDLHRKPSS